MASRRAGSGGARSYTESAASHTSASPWQYAALVTDGSVERFEGGIQTLRETRIACDHGEQIPNWQCPASSVIDTKDQGTAIVGVSVPV